MKQKDILYLVLAVGIFLGAGYLAYANLTPKQRGPKTVTVETVGKIPSSLNTDVVNQFHDPSKSIDFNLPVDLSGLGNNQPFGR